MSIGLTCTLAFAIFDSSPRGSPNDSAPSVCFRLLEKSSAPLVGNKPLDGFVAAACEPETAKDVSAAAAAATAVAAKVIKASALVAPQTSASLNKPKLLDGFIIFLLACKIIAPIGRMVSS